MKTISRGRVPSLVFASRMELLIGVLENRVRSNVVGRQDNSYLREAKTKLGARMKTISRGRFPSLVFASRMELLIGVLDIRVRRNAYGRQINSSIREAKTKLGNRPLEMVFIRAPKIVTTGKDVEVLATEGGDPVLVRQGKIMACTFHPELSADTRVHQEFLKLVKNGRQPE